MTNAEILAAVQILLRQLAPEVAAPVAPPAPEPVADPTVGNTPGGAAMTVYNGPTVPVTATGVLASGQPRYWPVPLPGEIWFGYLMRMCSIKRPDGLPYVPAQYRAQISNIFLGGGPTKQVDFPWHADCFSYPEEWRTQAQIDQTARDLAGWGDTHRRMQQQYSDDAVTGGSV